MKKRLPSAPNRRPKIGKLLRHNYHIKVIALTNFAISSKDEIGGIDVKAKKDCCQPLIDEAILSKEEKFTNFCKALSHPVRLTILKTLIERGVCISGDLSELFPVSASTVSEHLRILKDSGLVKGTIDGPRRNYCVNPEALNTFKFLAQDL